ncbi:MAG: FimV/HubP family polar landmark protein [Candidatus Thiodiazotropha sp.]
MIRKLSLAVAVATALSPMGALALGLGEIHPQSALNQVFKADIDLLSVTREELQDVRVSLASQEAFEKAGMQRPFHLTGLNFSTQMTASGQPVITISSKDPIREPFLNFLVEVNWPKGRLVREFTVLLDPPVTLQRKPAPVSTPTAGRASATRVTPSRRAASTAETSAVSMSGVAGAREYGPVQPNDNLWSIAKQMQQGAESIEQVMMALQDYNPSAFINDNVNNLKVGSVLRLPEDADVTTRSKREAREEFMAQTRAWRSGSSKPAPAPAEGAQQGKQVAAEPPPDRLKLVSPKPATGERAEREGVAADSDEIQRLQDEIMLVRESNEGALQENDALRDRVQELEKQIQDIQRLLTLKSDQLAEVQAAQSVAADKMDEMQPPAEPSAVEAPVAEEAVTEEPAVSVAEVPAPEEAPVEPVPSEAQTDEQAPAVAETEVTEPAPAAEEAAAPAIEEPAAPAEAAAPPAEEAAPAVQSPPVQAPKIETPPVAQPPVKKVGYFDSLRENSTLVAIVGGVAVVLIGLLTMIMRRRKEAEAEFAESILVSPDSDIVSRGGDDSSSLTSPTDETSFMSDFSPSDIDALQDETGEVDPLSEADVYIAYGRYQQAEELIKQAIEKFPDRVELKQKLLEIYYSAKKSDAFTDLAQEMSDTGLEDQNPDAWSKIASMGKELNPAHALFAGAAGLAAAEGLDEIADLGLDLDVPDITQIKETAPVSEAPVEEPEGLEEDFDSMDLSALDDLDEMDSESLETDLSLDSEFLNKMDGVEETQTTDDSDALDIDLSDLDVDSIPAASTDSAAQPEEEPQPFDLSEIEDAVDAATSGVEDAIELEDSENLDNLDLESIEKELESLSTDLDNDETADADDLSLLQSHSENLDLDSTDEITTKLDLARAYIDMGDNEGAKSILEEVIGEGSDTQQQEAKELLETLGS